MPTLRQMADSGALTSLSAVALLHSGRVEDARAAGAVRRSPLQRMSQVTSILHVHISTTHPLVETISRVFMQFCLTHF